MKLDSVHHISRDRRLDLIMEELSCSTDEYILACKGRYKVDFSHREYVCELYTRIGVGLPEKWYQYPLILLESPGLMRRISVVEGE
jgi:hypothetical protein